LLAVLCARLSDSGNYLIKGPKIVGRTSCYASAIQTLNSQTTDRRLVKSDELFDFTEIRYRVWSQHNRYTTNVQDQRVTGQGHSAT